jgi:hypothetical protein
MMAGGCGDAITFKERAQEDCKRTYDAGRSVPEPSGLEPFGSPARIAYARKVLPPFETLLRQMRALTPPADKAATMRSFTAALSKAIDDNRAAIVAVRARDVRAAQRLGIEIDADWHRADRLAARLGLSECDFLA